MHSLSSLCEGGNWRPDGLLRNPHGDGGGWGWGAVKVQRKCQMLNIMRVEPLGFIVGLDVDGRERGIKKDSQFWSEKPERV